MTRIWHKTAGGGPGCVSSRQHHRVLETTVSNCFPAIFAIFIVFANGVCAGNTNQTTSGAIGNKAYDPGLEGEYEYVFPASYESEVRIPTQPDRSVTVPRFSWQLRFDGVHVMQRAYRIQVSCSLREFDEKKLVWDTDTVESDRSVLVEYGGQPLEPRGRYYFRVKVWDQDGRESDWSKTSYWEMGLTSPSDWTAAWISPDAGAIDPQAEEVFLLRKNFAVRSGVLRATVYASSLGLYELDKFISVKRLHNLFYRPQPLNG